MLLLLLLELVLLLVLLLLLVLVLLVLLLLVLTLFQSTVVRDNKRDLVVVGGGVIVGPSVQTRDIHRLGD